MAEGEGFVHKVTPENIEEFAPYLRDATQPTEGGGDDTVEETSIGEGASADDEASPPEGLFQGEPFRIDLDRERPARPRRRVTHDEREAPRAERHAGPTEDAERGPILWRKPSLSATDAQRQTGHRTGSMRLTQAGWEVDGSVIDQTSYFRHDVFGRLDWEVGSEEPYREDARAIFDITVRGRSLGRHELRVTHKPSGEAGQGNYTTSLHWNDMTEEIHNLDLVREPFELYGPSEGRDGLFFLVIGLL